MESPKDDIKNKLLRENQDLRARCQFLEASQQKSRSLASEWQSFGKYTAQVLKSEVDSADKKIKCLESRVNDLRKENKELKDMCLYLDDSEGADSKLTPPEVSELLAQTTFISKLNLQGRLRLPEGSPGVIRNKTAVEEASKQTMQEMTEAVTELGKKVKQLEQEKQELVKSLSAAHLLVANTHGSGSSYRGGNGTPSPLEHPPRLEQLLTSAQGQDEGRNIDPDTVATAVMLLDMIQRLEVTEANGFSDLTEQAEIETLKVLISVAWQRIQEKITAVHN